MLNSNEKRRFPRIDIRVPLQYKELREGTQASKGALSRNLSEGGVRFNTDKFVSLACRMVIELNIPSSPKPIRAISKVAWIKKLSVGEDFEIGNQFLDMSREDRSMIADYVTKSVPKNI